MHRRLKLSCRDRDASSVTQLLVSALIIVLAFVSGCAAHRPYPRPRQEGVCAARYAPGDDGRVVKSDELAVDGLTRRTVCRAVADTPWLAGYRVKRIASRRGVTTTLLEATTPDGWTGAQ